MFVQVFIFFIMFIIFSFWFNKKPENLPPGEWGLPFVGYLPFMERKITKTLNKLQRKHGKIYTVKVGSKIFIILGDSSLIKTAFQKPELSGRPFYYHFSVINNSNDLGVVFSNFPVWSTNRRFCLRTLRDFGLGKTSILDDIILDEATSLVKELGQHLDKPVGVDWALNVTALNVTFRLLASRRYDVDDERIIKFVKYVNDNIEDMEGLLSIFAVFPWLIPLIPKYVKDKWMHEARMKEKKEKILDMLKELVKEHKETLDKSNPRDYVDRYLIEQEIQKSNPDYRHWGDEDLLSTIFDFFMAGAETTSSTMRWFMLYMGRYPEVQERVQKEIDEVIPRERHISLLDKDSLPALEALTYEVSRVISMLPNAVPHEATEETTLDGFVIPKGAVVMPNIEYCHNNSKDWKFPNKFSLENFLDDEGKIIRNIEAFLPFSLGKRQCPGESLAKMELFIFMGTILQNFKISEPEDQNVPLVPIETSNILNFVPKFKIILNKR